MTGKVYRQQSDIPGQDQLTHALPVIMLVLDIVPVMLTSVAGSSHTGDSVPHTC